MLAILHVVVVSFALGGSVYAHTRTCTLPGDLPTLPEPRESPYKPPEPRRAPRPR